jgi:hypothetical protein
MIKNNELSTFEIAFKGYLWVNIPIILIALLVWYFLLYFFNFSSSISILIGTSIGWIYWEFTIKKWIKWALDNNVEPDRLLKIGQFSLLLWNSRQIDKILKEKK